MDKPIFKIYNTLSNEVEVFHPINPGECSLYVCGPTVYDKPHLGHARCYVVWDILYRYLLYLGYNVKYTRNFTDIDDKILAKANSQGKEPHEIAKENISYFKDAMHQLNTLDPTKQPRVNEYKTLDAINKMIESLIQSEYAYETEDGVYFRVSKKKDYGKLSKKSLEGFEIDSRIENSKTKESPYDFVLWKKTDSWGFNSPWGTGRPGWHIECSAFNQLYNNGELDIHAGGMDLIFPHHENEIAQSEAYCKETSQFSRYWMHNGFVTINGEKMAKSVGNFMTIEDLLKDYDGDVIRYFILSHHYKSPVEFSDEALQAAKNRIKKIRSQLAKIKHPDNSGIFDQIELLFEEDVIDSSSLMWQFEEALSDNLNTPKALAILNKAVDQINDQNKEDKEFVSQIFSMVYHLGFRLQGVEYKTFELSELQEALPEYIDTNDKTDKDFLSRLISLRDRARKEQNWVEADKIRDKLLALGFKIYDTPEITGLDYPTN